MYHFLVAEINLCRYIFTNHSYTIHSIQLSINSCLFTQQGPIGLDGPKGEPVSCPKYFHTYWHLRSTLEEISIRLFVSTPPSSQISIFIMGWRVAVKWSVLCDYRVVYSVFVMHKYHVFVTYFRTEKNVDAMICFLFIPFLAGLAHQQHPSAYTQLNSSPSNRQQCGLGCSTPWAQRQPRPLLLQMQTLLPQPGCFFSLERKHHTPTAPVVRLWQWYSYSLIPQPLERLYTTSETWLFRNKFWNMFEENNNK